MSKQVASSFRDSFICLELPNIGNSVTTLMDVLRQYSNHLRQPPRYFVYLQDYKIIHCRSLIIKHALTIGVTSSILGIIHTCTGRCANMKFIYIYIYNTYAYNRHKNKRLQPVHNFAGIAHATVILFCGLH